MLSKLKNKSKRAFILMEVLIGLSLLSFLLPFLFEDQKLFQKQIDQLNLYNEFEIAFRKEIFDLYQNLYSEPYYSFIDTLDNKPHSLNYKEIKISPSKTFQSVIEIQKREKKDQNKNYHLEVVLKVLHFPSASQNYSSNIQNFYLKKSN